MKRMIYSVVLLTLCVSMLPACSIGCLLKPKNAFDAKAVPKALDYDEAGAWAALPDRDDNANRTPSGIKSAQKSAPADAFYLHPTTWFSRERWNDNTKEKPSRELVDQMLMTAQASIFNGCCRVYAPRFRQMTIGAFYGEKKDMAKSANVAFGDVERAFNAFLKKTGDRPFVIASHSQGSMHAMRLLQRIDADPALRKRFVVAYIPGFAHPMSHFKNVYKALKPCSKPDQTQCVASWDTYVVGAKVEGHEPLVYWKGGKLVKLPMSAPRQCTNPVSWSNDGKKTKPAQHKGAVEPNNKGKAPDFKGLLFSSAPIGLKVVGLKKPRPKLLTAQCVKGVLRVPDLDGKYPVTETQSGNYHMMDYELFWLDIRQNVQQRVNAWQSMNQTAVPKPIPPLQKPPSTDASREATP